MAKLGGYMGKMLRVDLTKELITEEKVDEAILRNFVGVSGLGVKIMYDEVPPDIEWNDPRNRIIWLTGPFTGTKAPGSGLYGVATKSPLSNRFGVSHCQWILWCQNEVCRIRRCHLSGSGQEVGLPVSPRWCCRAARRCSSLRQRHLGD